MAGNCYFAVIVLAGNCYSALVVLAENDCCYYVHYAAVTVLAGNCYFAVIVLAGNCYSARVVLAENDCCYLNNSFLLCGRSFAALGVVVALSQAVVVDFVATVVQCFQFHPVDSFGWGSNDR